MINDKAREISATEYSDRQAQIDSTLSDLHTAIPAIVISYDNEARTVKAQPAIQRVFSDGEGISGAVNLPPCVDVPVVFPGGGGFEITFPIEEGDECLLIFSERCIDGWFETGEPSPPGDYRKHDLSDGFALVGIRSLANKKPTSNDEMVVGSENNNIKISKESVSINRGNAHMTMTEDKIDCNLVIHCKNVVTEKLNLNNHIHAGVEPGAGSTLEGR